MSILGHIFAFELRLRWRQPPLHIFAFIALAMGLLMTATDLVEILGGTGRIAVNSPHVINQAGDLLFQAMGLITTTAFVAPAIVRDQQWRVQQLFYSTPLEKVPYLLGRYLGATSAAIYVVVCGMIGVWLGTSIEFHPAERYGDSQAIAVPYNLAVFLIPNIIVTGALFFSLATLTRKTLYAYVGLVALFAFYSASGKFMDDIENQWLAAVIDPFGIRTHSLAVRYWTIDEKNTALAPVIGVLGFNRVLWLIVAGFVTTWTLFRFRMQLDAPKARKAGVETETVATSAVPRPATDAAAKIPLRFDARATAQQIRTRTSLEVRQVLESVAFIVICLFAIINISFVSISMFTAKGSTTFPVTHLMLDAIIGGMALFGLIVVIFYSGELLHRERDAGLNEIYDAMPCSSWVYLLAKLAALVCSVVALLVVAMACTIVVQLAHGYTHIELGLYLKAIFGLHIWFWVQWCVVAIFFQALVHHKYFGFTLTTLFILSGWGLTALGLEHGLIEYTSHTQSTHYSDMNGFGHHWVKTMWYCLYWGAMATAMVFAAKLVWARGTDQRWPTRSREIRRRLTLRNCSPILVAVCVWLGAGGYIYYTTCILNSYRDSDDEEELAARYEREFGQFKGLAQPTVVSVDAEIDIYPEQRRVAIRNRMGLVNRHSSEIADLHILYPSRDFELVSSSLASARLVKHATEFGYYIYELPQPLAPGAALEFEYSATISFRGFKEGSSNPSFVANGSFFNNRDVVPVFGYDRNLELADPNARRKLELPERPRMASIDDAQARMRTALAHDSDWIDFSATMSTSEDQIAVAPGYLVDQGQADGRRWFRYEMDAKILGFYAFISARYAVRRDQWVGRDSKRPVDIEVFYHPAHDANIDRMIVSVKDSLDYFTTEFSPYQHRQARILEFPNYRSFAQSFPNTIPYSEALGFIANPGPRDIDYVYYVTAHEMAHQWWGHQVAAGDVEGSTMLVESMSQYSALMVMQRNYGGPGMRKFLRFELDRYLSARSNERFEEKPLLLVENQAYIHYRKGSVVMFAAAQYLGEDQLNRVLAQYIADVGFQSPPFTTSRELYDRILAVTPEKHRTTIVDMFEKITLHDNRSIQARAHATADGHHEVTIEYLAHKRYADGGGRETDASEHLEWIEFAVYGPEDADGEPSELYRQMHPVEPGPGELTIRVRGTPTRAGIDPRHLLIDRSPKDNVVRVDIDPA